jgi:hypothetical protein
MPVVRPGLVAIGIGLLLVAGGVVVAVFESPGPGSAGTTHLLSIALPGDDNASGLVWGINGSNVAFALSWHASAGVNAVLSIATGCLDPSSHCAAGAVLVRWGGPATAGAWSTSSPADFPWLLQFTNAGPGAVNIAVTTSAARAAAPAPVGWAYDMFLVAGATLGAIGAVALFLGLFLQAGVYRRAAPMPPRDPPAGPEPPSH